MTLKNHMHRFLYECPICQHLTRTRKTMWFHLKKYHPGIKLSDCKRISTRTYEYVEIKVEDDD